MPPAPSSLALAIVATIAGCNDAVTLTIASDRPIPTAIDAICVGIADRELAGGHFGRRYPIAALPQTLRVEAGGASEALAWVRADRGGVPVARAASTVAFSDDVTLGLTSCVKGHAGAPATRGAAVGPGAARLVASQGQGGTLVVAFGAAGVQFIDAANNALVARDAAIDLGGAVTAAIALDLDGDCDDDIVAATATTVTILRRDGATFVVAGTLTAGATALAAADVDGDGAADLFVGAGGGVVLYRNDGAGGFTPDAAAVPANGLTSVAALATGDLDGDGFPDLVAGQAGGPLRAWLGGGATFRASPGAVPPVALDVAGLALADADGDFDPDLAVAVRGAPLRLYVDRDGRLEDQSFVRLPQDPAVVADAVAIGGFDDGCEPDAIAVGAGGAVLDGVPGGALEREVPAAGSDIVLVDIDDDGAVDAIVATPEGVTWLAR